MEERTEETWKKRKLQLVESGVSAPAEERLSPVRSAIGVLAFILIVLAVWWGMRGTKTPEPDVASTKARIAEEPIDVEVKLQTTDGPITVRSTQILSLRPRIEDGLVEVQVGEKLYKIQSSETGNLPAFFRKQLDAFHALQKSP